MTMQKSLKSQLLRMNLLSVSLAFLFLLIFIFIRDFIQYRNIIEQNLTSKATVIASNLSAAVSFDDKQAVNETLTSLKNDVRILQAIVYKSDKSVFVTLKPEKRNVLPTEKRKSSEVEFKFKTADIFQDILIDNNKIGILYLQQDITYAYKNVIYNVLLLILISMLSLISGVYLFNKLQKKITTPLLSIINTMQTVSKDKDYTVRVDLEAEYEIEALKNEFNLMLEELQKNNDKIQHYKKNLELLVLEKTQQLKQSNSLLEKQLNEKTEAESRLNHALKAEKRFISSMSHEMRTPLNAIIGFVEILIYDEPTVKQKKLLKVVKSSSEHLLALISDILDVSKIDSGQMELRLSNFNLNALIANCISIAGTRVKENVNLAISIPEFEFSILSDKIRLKQIFLNILSNAAKFTNEGEISFSNSKCENIDDKHVSLEFTVEDSGIGITPEKMKDLFSPFKQLNSSNEGTGLGLFISKSLAKLMGGDIEIKNKPNGGLKVILSFQFEKKPPINVVKSEDSDNTDINDLCKDLSVLLVEDLDVNIAVAKEFLNRFFNISKITVAKNGIEGVKLAKSTGFDIIFMDIQMPIMTGIEATREIRKIGITTPIFAMSADAFLEHISQAKKAGVNDYITKPINAKNIRSVLNNYFSGKYKDDTSSVFGLLETNKSEIKNEIPEDNRKFKEIILDFFTETFDDKLVAEELLSESLESIDNCLNDINKALEMKDRDLSRKAFHKFYGLLRNCNLMNQAKLFHSIHKKLKDNGDLETIFADFNNFEKNFKAKL